MQTQEAARRNGDWMWGGDGAYVPSPGTAMDMTLRLHETVYVFDMGLTAHPARAMLDSGALRGASYSKVPILSTYPGGPTAEHTP